MQARHASLGLPSTGGRLYHARPAALRGHGRRWHAQRPARASFGTERGTQNAPNLPAAPPTFIPPPPPPPPPPPSQGPKNELSGLSRRGLFGLIMGGSLLWYWGLNSGVPLVAVDRENRLAVLRTKGGNLVGVALDSRNRMFLFDRMGRLYYDTEDPNLGIFIVDNVDDMFNMFVDKQGVVQTQKVGNLSQMVSIPVNPDTRIGGKRLADLSGSFRELRDGRLTAFLRPFDPDDENVWQYLMPPGAPPEMRDGKLYPPPLLEDMQIILDTKKQLTDAQRMEVFSTLKREGQ